MKRQQRNTFRIWQPNTERCVEIPALSWLIFFVCFIAAPIPLHASHITAPVSSNKSTSAQSAAPKQTTMLGTTQTVSALSSGGLGASVSSFNIQSFQADLFTGSAGADIPILVPAGAAGVAPKILLSYNSGVVDDLAVDNDPDQADWTGLGWTLDTGGFILRDTKGTTSTSDDTFKLIFGGHTYELVSIGSGNYRTKDETFMAINYVSANDYWTVKTKDGITHRFGYTSNSRATGLTFGPNIEVPVTFRYYVDEVSTSSGVSVRYNYFKQSSSYNGKAYDQAVYPDTITYAYRNGSLIGNPRTVTFIRGARTDWKDVSPTWHTSYHQLYRLDAIEVKVKARLVRRYNFTYDYSIDRDPNQSWQGGATGDLTLKSVTMLGADGTTAMPPIAFTYTGPVLASASNGIGGSVSFTYERIKPLYNVYTTVFRYDENGVMC